MAVARAVARVGVEAGAKVVVGAESEKEAGVPVHAGGATEVAIVVITAVVEAAVRREEIDALDTRGGDPGAGAGTAADPEIELETDGEAMVAHSHAQGQGQDRVRPDDIPTDPATGRIVDLDAPVIATLGADPSGVRCPILGISQ